jgi:hypothetical protein
MLRRLKQVAPYVRTGEALAKLAVVLTVVVPVPVTGLALVGFWLDYYKLSTFPLLTIAGIILGTFVAFIGVIQIIFFGHKEGGKEGEELK